MTNKKNTKKVIIASIVAMFLCFATLFGTTVAWFTDSVSNTNNIIKSGNVDVELWHTHCIDTQFGYGYYDDVAEEVDGTTALFVNADKSPILWEPGAEVGETFRIKNVGTLALKYEFRIKPVAKTSTEDGKSLADIIAMQVIYDDDLSDNLLGGPIIHLDYIKDGFVVEGELLAGEAVDYCVALGWEPSVNDNDYNVDGGLSIIMGIELVATQKSHEADGFGTGFDVDAEYPVVSKSVVIPATATESLTVATAGKNAVEATIPAELANTLVSSGVSSLSLVHTEPVVEADKIVFEQIELIDQNGKIIDLSDNTTKFTITLPAQPQMAGRYVEIKHDGEIVASVLVGDNGEISYEVEHFCKVEVALKLVSNAQELKDAIAAGEKYIMFANDITVSASKGGYSKAGIVLNKDIVVDGRGYSLTVNNGAWGTWDCAVYISAGTLKNVTVKGAMRGVFMAGASGDIYLDNVNFENVIYTFNSDAGNKQYGVYISNSTLNGWTSFSNAHKEVVFTGCTFNEGNGYAFCRPYNNSKFVDCTFAEGFEFDTKNAESIEIINCKYGSTQITAENVLTLKLGEDLFFYNGLGNAIVK